MARINEGFNKLIPGQSLTLAPGSQPYEKPPQFTDGAKAMDFLATNLWKPESINKLLLLLEADVPVEGLVRTILYSGFAEGKWSYDLMVLIAGPLAMMIIAMAKMSGLKDFRVVSNEDKVSAEDAKLYAYVDNMKKLKKPKEDTQAIPEASPTSSIPTSGLMGAM